MALIKFKNVGIKSVSACVPKNIEKNKSLSYLFTNKELQEVIKSTGISERRIASESICASDLCYKAADNLLNNMDIDRKTIDMLIFMSQAPDYKIPATSPHLQYRLGLPKTTATIDITHSCSGYVYSLSTAFSFVTQDGINRVLLLDGETFSKYISKKDKINIPLYGDAGTATLIEKGNFGHSYFSLNSDGSGVDVLKIDAGGARNPTSLLNINEVELEDGNFRSPHQLYMDGMEVFNFTMMNVPKDIKKILKFACLNFYDIDKVVFHQANKLMTDFFSKKLKILSKKVPYSIDRFGNTSSASIPLTIVSELKTKQNNNVILSGFGAGLSWGTALLNLKGCEIFPLIEI